jgi:hypothetical protein
MKNILSIILMVVLASFVYTEEIEGVPDILSGEDEYAYINRLKWSMPNLLEDAGKKNEIITQFILQKLQNGENILEKLPFLSCVISNDDKMKLYKWDATQSGDDIYSSIIVYDTGDEKIIVPVKDLVDGLPILPLTSHIPENKWHYLDYDIGDVIKNEEESIYILKGRIMAGEGFYFIGFIGVEILNEEVKIVDLFSGRKQIGFKLDRLTGRKFDSRPLVIDVTAKMTEDSFYDYNLRTHTRPFRIEVLRVKMNEDERGLEFELLLYVYNGNKIIGNYNILNEDNILE